MEHYIDTIALDQKCQLEQEKWVFILLCMSMKNVFVIQVFKDSISCKLLVICFNLFKVLLPSIGNRL